MIEYIGYGEPSRYVKLSGNGDVGRPRTNRLKIVFLIAHNTSEGGANKTRRGRTYRLKEPELAQITDSTRMTYISHQLSNKSRPRQRRGRTWTH